MADFEIPAGTVVLETAVDFEEIDRQIDREMPARGQRAGEAVGEGFRRGFRSHVGDDVGGEVERSLEGAEEGSRQVRREFERTGGVADGLREELESTAQAGTGLAAIFGTRLVGSMRGLLGWVGRTTTALVGVTSIGVSTAGSGLQRLGRELRENGGAWEYVGRAVEGTGSALRAVGGILLKVAGAITGMKVAAVAGAAALAHMSNRATDDFIPSWNRVLTLIPEGTRGLEQLRDDVDALGSSLGLTAETTNRTFYNVLSAMPELVERPADALMVLEAALKATATGFAEGETAARAITAILNAFNLEASEAERVSDALFAAQNQGVLTFGEIATEIGKVSNLTSSMNADFEDLLGILATITPSGENVSQTMTQIRSALREMLDPTQELNQALGGDAAGFVRDRGLLAALQRIAEVTEGDPQLISQMFGRGEAIQLVNSLAQNMDTLEQKTRDVREAGGETEQTLEKMNEDFQRQADILSSELDRALRQLGDTWQGLRRISVGALADIIGAINDADAAVDNYFDNLIIGLSRFGSAPAAVQMWQMLKVDIDEAADAAAEFDERQQRAIETRPGRPAFMRPSDARPAAGPRLERPESPAGAFAEDIEEFAAGRQLQAMLEFMETGDLERYEAALRGIQLEVNELVEAQTRRLRSMGATASELQPLLSLFDQEVEKYRNLKLELTPLADATREFFLAMRELPDVVGPDVEGFEEGPGGMLVATEDQQDRLAELMRFVEDLEDAQLDSGEAAVEVREKMDELGLSYDDLTQSILMNIRALGLDALGLAHLGFQVGETDEDAEGLQATLADIEGTARGLLHVADAAGILSEELESVLRGAIDVAGAIESIDADGLSVGAVAQGVGGAISLISGVANAIGGTSPEERQRRQELIENTRAIERLRNNIDALARAFGEVSGEQVAGVEAISAPFEGVDPGDSEGVADALGEAWRRMQEAGITQSDVEAFAEAHDIHADAVLMWIQNGGMIADTGENFERAAEQMQALHRAAQEFNLERMFEGFEGTLQEIDDRFALLDDDDPLRKLEEYRDAFLEFANLPSGLQQEIENLNLDTAEGRARLEEIMLQLFQGMQQEGFDVGQLGKLTPELYKEAILQIEKMVDQVGESAGEGASRSFQIFRGVSELQAHQLLGKADTRNVLLRFIWDELIAIRGGMGFEAPTQGPTLLPPAPALEPSERTTNPSGPTVEPSEAMTNPPAPRAPRAPSDPGMLQLNFDSTVSVEAGVGEDAEHLARRVSEEISRSVPRDLLRKIKEEMAEDYLSEQRTLGRVRKV